MQSEASQPDRKAPLFQSDNIIVLSEEVETTMRLMGVTDLSQLHPAMVNATRLEHELPKSLPEFALSLRGKL